MRAFRLGWGTWCGVCPRGSIALLPLLLAVVAGLVVALHCVLKSQPQPVMVCRCAPALSLFLRSCSPGSLNEVFFRDNVMRMSL